MDAPSIFTAREAAFLAALDEAGVSFLIVGLAAAALQGAPAVNQGIDLWFADLADPQLGKVLRRFNATYIPPGPENPPLLVGDAVKLFDIVLHMHGLKSFEEELKEALRVAIGPATVSVLSLERIIVSKRATGRPKDKAILPALEAAAEVVRSRRNRHSEPS